jgi:hypothetical protein
MPVAAGNTIFCHMPKTGGTTVSNYLKGFLAGRDRWPLLHGHSPARDIPAHSRKGKTLFGTIRDPWSWYASWWMHAVRDHSYRAALKEYGKGSYEFASVLRGVTSTERFSPPHDVGIIWATRSPKDSRMSFAGSEAGLYSWVFNHIYANDVCSFARLSHLAEDLSKILRMEVSSHDLLPMNTHQQRKSTPPVWTDELIEMVWHADAAIIQKFGFDPP